MKKFPLLAISFVFIIACNNNKNNNTKNNREKDDYGKMDNQNNNNENSENSSWASSDRNKFLKECVASFEEGQEDLANKICPCVLRKLEKEYSSFSEAETKGGESVSNRMALQCKEEVAGNGDNNNVASNWSSSDEKRWMKDCTTPLLEKVSSDKANNYCSCVLERLKEVFSSYDEMNTKGTEEMGVELGNKCIKELGVEQ